ncbi:MAG: AAA family ATPase [Polyangiaceae bacterium]|nr:AAA family ATPase [Polyangiaceae bacterium]
MTSIDTPTAEVGSDARTFVAAKNTRLTVCVGGGGVGKTTTAAAFALSLARKNRKTLVITVDPARRLADALGTEVGRRAQQVQIEGAGGLLFAQMPDTRMSLDDFMVWMFEDPARRKHVMENPAYRELGDSLAGVHEIITIGLLQAEVDSGQWDEVVLDTAPSRHALAFLTYPSRMLALLEAKALTWLAAMAGASDPSIVDNKIKTGSAKSGRSKASLFEWGRSKAEAIMGRVVGIDGLKNLSALFADMVSVRERWATMARRTDELFRNPSTQYFIIAAPTGGAIADARYLVENLKRKGLRPTTIVLNRAESAPPACETRIIDALQSGNLQIAKDQANALLTVLRTMQAEHQSRGDAAHNAIDGLRAITPQGVRMARLPYVHQSEPSAIVIALADAWLDAWLDALHSSDRPHGQSDTGSGISRI